MAKLTDLMSKVVNNSSDLGMMQDYATVLKFAYALGVSVNKAADIYRKNGNGYIYAKGGFSMPDTPYMRRKMVANFGDCVVIDKSGEMWVRTKHHIGARNRKRAEIGDKITRRQIAMDEQELREKRRVNRLFKDGQTNPSPKRGGKANGYGDFGKYVNFRGVRIEATERKTETKFATIIVHY